jgi:hypothetical protein
MAKSQKQSNSAASAEKSAGAGKKIVPAKKAPKAAAGGGASRVPAIDTSLAAATAARMVTQRDALTASPETGEKRESGAFRQLKQSLAKPSGQGPAGFLQNTAPQKKSNLPFGARKQVGHNQTFGADVNRAGVPRRTGGG